MVNGTSVNHHLFTLVRIYTRDQSKSFIQSLAGTLRQGAVG